MTCIDHGKAKPKYATAHYQGKSTSLHRVVYAKHHGVTLASLDGLEIRHTCDNPRCINADHLIPGTRSDNMRDMHDRGRAASNLRNFDQTENRKRGSEQANSRWTDDDIRAIRDAYAGGEKQVSIAARYNCRQSDISRIVRRQSWQHVN